MIMKFLKSLFKSSAARKKERLARLKAKVEIYERHGKTIEAASIYHEIEMLETEILEAEK